MGRDVADLDTAEAFVGAEERDILLVPVIPLTSARSGKFIVDGVKSVPLQKRQVGEDEEGPVEALFAVDAVVVALVLEEDDGKGFGGHLRSVWPVMRDIDAFNAASLREIASTRDREQEKARGDSVWSEEQERRGPFMRFDAGVARLARDCGEEPEDEWRHDHDQWSRDAASR